MKTVKHTTSPTVVTIGNFDGLHKGHQKLIKKTVQIAEKNNLKSLVCSFNCNTKGAQIICVKTVCQSVFKRKVSC